MGFNVENNNLDYEGLKRGQSMDFRSTQGQGQMATIDKWKEKYSPEKSPKKILTSSVQHLPLIKNLRQNYNMGSSDFIKKGQKNVKGKEQ